METRANFVLIGSFTLAVIAAAFGFVLWFQSLHTTKARSPLRIVFEGPATGLRNGGSVNFNGIRVGEVVGVKLDNPRRVVALAMIENNAPVRKDTLVGLEFQGLTGVAAISLKGGDEAAPPVPLDEDGVPVLTADPAALQDVTESIRATLQNVNRIVADNQESVKNSLRNLETFTGALARNSEKIDNVMLRVDGVMGKAEAAGPPFLFAIRYALFAIRYSLFAIRYSLFAIRRLSQPSRRMREQGVDEAGLRGQVAAQRLRTAILAGNLVEQAFELGDVAVDRLLEVAVGAVFAGDLIEGLLS